MNCDELAILSHRHHNTAPYHSQAVDAQTPTTRGRHLNMLAAIRACHDGKLTAIFQSVQEALVNELPVHDH